MNVEEDVGLEDVEMDRVVVAEEKVEVADVEQTRVKQVEVRVKLRHTVSPRTTMNPNQISPTADGNNLEQTRQHLPPSPTHHHAIADGKSLLVELAVDSLKQQTRSHNSNIINLRLSPK